MRKTRYSNRLTAHLKMHFPQVLEVVRRHRFQHRSRFSGALASLESLQRARSFTIERFFIDHNSRNMERIRERLKQIRKAVRVDK